MELVGMKGFRWIGLALTLVLSQTVMATTDVLYITNGDDRDIQAIQGNSIIEENLNLPTTSGTPRFYPIAVGDSIWVMSYLTGEPGRLELDSTLTLLHFIILWKHPQKLGLR